MAEEMTYPTRIEAILLAVREAELPDKTGRWVAKRPVMSVSEATAALTELVNEARIDENQQWLDKINNYKPDRNAISFGSASGAIEVQGFKNGFEARIEALKAGRPE